MAFTLLVVCLAGASGARDAAGASLETRLERLAPHASGVFLARVVAVRRHDERPVDGDLYEDVELAIERSTGSVTTRLYVVVEAGGFVMEDLVFDPPGAHSLAADTLAVPEPPRLLEPGRFRPGERYWFATASSWDEHHPEGIIALWPTGSVAAESTLREVVAKDLLRAKPQYISRTGLTWSCLEPDGPQPRLSVSRGRRVLWARTLGGPLVRRGFINDAWLGPVGHSGAELDSVPGNPWVIGVECSVALPEWNAYRLPGGRYYATTLSNLETGTRVAEQIAKPQIGRVELVTVGYDRSERRIYERRQDYLEHGGRAAGADQEAWLRRIVRRYDPDRDRILSEEVFRFGVIPIGGVGKSAWLPVTGAMPDSAARK